MAQEAYYPDTGKTVLPPLPSNLNMYCAQRTVKQNHLNNQGTYTQNWIITGFFADPKQQKQKTLGKIAVCYIDFDLTDTLVHQGYAVQAKEKLLSSGVTELFKDRKPVLIKDLDPNDKRFAPDLVKATLSFMPVESLKQLTAQHFTPILEKQFIPYIGKPSIITYTGHGCHAYYWLADTEGYTMQGAGLAGENVRVNADDFKKYFKALYAHCNDTLGYQAVDPKVSDLGTRCTRELGSMNRKNSANPKLVERFLLEYTAIERRVKLADFKELPVQATFTDKVATASTQGRGRPPKFKPVRVKFDEELSVEINNQVHTMTVADFDKRFDEIMQAQGQTDKVRNLRLSQLGQGSLNMFATKSGKGVMFILTASKYMQAGDTHWKADATGNYNGFYQYDGMSFDLIRNERGAVRKNSSNLQQILMHDPRTASLLQYNSRLEQVFVHRDLHLDAYGSVDREVRIARTTEWFKFKDAHYITFEKVFNAPYGLDNVPDAQISRVVRSVAMQRAFDPVTDWIESIRWDNKRRLDGANSWLCNMLNIGVDHPKHELYSAYGRAVMLGILRNIYVGNTYPDVQHVLTLAGGQGVGKSLASAVLGLTELLGMDYFHDSGIDMGAGAHKGDQIASMLGCFLVELPEAISLSSNSTDASIKAFLTTKKDKGRFAFGREHEERLRATYFVTNSNDNIFLSDHTGNRRYLVIDCFDDLNTPDARLDVDSLRAVLPQIYAEAYQRCILGQGIPADRQGNVRKYEGVICEEWNLTPNERNWQTAHNMKFTQPDYIVEELSDILSEEMERGITCVSYAEVKRKLTNRDPSARLSNVKFANAMTRCGWRRATVKGKNVWLPLESNIVARDRVEPEASKPEVKKPEASKPEVKKPEASKPEPVKTPKDLEGALALLARNDFRQACQVDNLKKILRIKETIESTATIQPAQVALLIRYIDCEINSQAW
jgi:hypothetical protein